MKLSVTIITYNEEKNIERAVRSVGFADEVIVVDSHSSDRTVELAQGLGAKVHQRPFDGFGQQKNFAAGLCQGDWVLNIDADEEVSLGLMRSIEKIIEGHNLGQGNTSHVLYLMRRVNFFCGRPMYHGGWYPDYKARLCLRGKAAWTQPNVHEDLLPLHEGQTGTLDGELLHFSFPTVKSQILTNLKYASLGARDLKLRKKGRPSLVSVCLRPLLKFVECYLLKRGFLDGTRGLIIAVNAAHSMFMKYTFAYLDENHD